MKKFIISSELSMDNFTNKIILVRNSMQIIESKENPIKDIQDNLNDYVFTIAKVNVNALVNIPIDDWDSSEVFIKNAFIKLRKSNISGYLIHYDSCSEIWYDDHGSDMRVTVKVKEINDNDSVVVSPMMTHELYTLNDIVSMNLLNNLWDVTQLYEEYKFKELGYFIDNRNYYELNSDEYNNHMSKLWGYEYERQVDNIENTYVYQNETYNSIKAFTKEDKMRFNIGKYPVSYFFTQERLDYNDYDLKTGDLITYTNKQYIDGDHKEQALLVMVIRSEDDLQDFFSTKL
tara:strand:+ start:581 stop:1447 length:867 start_codon:yes stop_codon:yes gene_type:complete